MSKEKGISLAWKFVLLIPVFMAIPMLLTNAEQFKEGKGSYFGDVNECIYSEYNQFSNSTRGYVRWWNNCYVETNVGWYEDKKECGLFGISCYERSEPIMKQIKGEVCFNIKTGKIC